MKKILMTLILAGMVLGAAAGCVMDLAEDVVNRVADKEKDKIELKQGDVWCPECGEENVKLQSKGLGYLVEGYKHKYKCKNCGYKFD